MIVVRDDTEKARLYAIMRRLATALLGAFIVLFVVTAVFSNRHPDFAPFWVKLVRAMAEAAMAGGFADWFAVTALFRHPLGIPIPHTAIVAQRKDKIGRSLGNFVGSNFLSREVIARQLAGMRLGAQAAAWLSEPGHQRRVATAIASGVARAAESVPRDVMQSAVHETLVGELRKVQAAPLLADVLAVATAGDRHHEMLNQLITLLRHVVQENKEIIRVRIAQESPWWVPNAVDDKLYQKIVVAIERTLDDVSTNDQHPLRGRFDHAVRRFMENLNSSPDTIARAEAIKERLLSHPVVAELSDALLGAAQASLVKYAGPDAPSPEPLERAVAAIAGRALASPAFLEEVDGTIERLIIGVVEQYRTEVADLIARTVEGWDAKDASNKIEVQVGRDLQFIRINGTLVGGLVGLVLYLISAFLG